MSLGATLTVDLSARDRDTVKGFFNAMNQTLPTSFRIRSRAIQRIEKGKRLTRSMGKRVYKKYIASPEWQEKVREYRKKYCEICGLKLYLNLHHASYQNLLVETDKDFITLCKYCHLACHTGIMGRGKLRNPSHAGFKIANRMRVGCKLKQEKTALFLRRRWAAKNEGEKLPDISFFRRFFSRHIKDKKFPFDLAIAKL